MKKPEIIQKLPKLPLSELGQSDVQVILRLITILAATHLASKVNRVIKNINKLERPEDVFKYLK